MTATIHGAQCSEAEATLFVSLELSAKRWRLTSATGPGDAPRETEIAAGDRDAFAAVVLRAKERFGLSAAAAVVSCYEAGRDGFWVARWLARLDVTNLVVDSSSIEVPRRGRRAKTDRLDGRSLLRLLLRYAAGDRAVWRVVTVPSEEVEDRRHVHRALDTLKHDRTRVTNRIRSLLATQGARTGRYLPRDLRTVRRWDGAPISAGLQQRLEREVAHLQLLAQQIRALEGEQRLALGRADDAMLQRVTQLRQLRGIGRTSAWLFVMEAFGWRQFQHARQIGAMSGLAPTPYQSGGRHREQGIGKTGNRRWRTMAIEIAWAWLRHQPRSALSRWYAERFAAGGPRGRRIGIVALARRLLIALWRYLDRGVIPADAQLKVIAPA